MLPIVLKISNAFLTVALKLQEATSELSHNDVRARLTDAINDHHRGSGSWGYLVDYTGDGQTGDVIYSCDGDCMKAPYEMASVGDKATCEIGWDEAVDVYPRTTYEEEAEDEDHYAAMEEALKRDRLYTALPLYERFISKKERDAASPEDFAGKGKSFPVLQPGDVMAAVRSIGRAGEKNVGSSTLKSRIIAIAKRKGWTKYLPKSWRDGDSKESALSGHQGVNLALVESAATIEPIVLREARSDYEIKLIAPGKGSSAFYPAEVLKRDGPKVFAAGTHVYLNHPTAAEEAARPEGDVSNLAGVLSTTAQYHENHAKGPGLYARMKVFADHAQTVEEKAPFVGMSIRAYGNKESGTQKDGLPVLKELISAESVDVVTRAGAGGMILTESAATAANQEGDLTLQEAQKIAQDAVTAATAPLLARALREDAREEAGRVLGAVSLSEKQKAYIVDRCLPDLPVKEGALDIEKFRERVVAEAKAYASSIEGGQVRGMGATIPVQLTEADEKRIRKDEKRLRKEAKRGREESVDIFARLVGGDQKVAEAMARRGEAA